MEDEAQANEAKPAVPEELWGQKVDSLSVNGVEETARKFCAHVRRALILYVLLLKENGDLDALRGVINALRGSSFGSYSDLCRSDLCFTCLFSDMSKALLMHRCCTATCSDRHKVSPTIWAFRSWMSKAACACQSLLQCSTRLGKVHKPHHSFA